jgi:hypothetical protein
MKKDTIEKMQADRKLASDKLVKCHLCGADCNSTLMGKKTCMKCMNKPDRSKIYPTQEELTSLGFELKGEGGDPRDFWHEIDLSNEEAHKNDVYLSLDAYSDFYLEYEEDCPPIPLNFQSIDEIRIFISVFKRPFNHAFSSLLDI